MKGSPMTKIPTNIASIRMPLKEISLATASLHPARGIVGAGISTLALILASASPAFAQEIIDDKVNDGVATVPGDQASPWVVDGYIYVGDQGMGTLTVETGGVIEQDSSFASVIGYRSEEHTSELQSLMRISYAVICLKTITTIPTL